MELVGTIVMDEEEKLESYATVSFASAVNLIATAYCLPYLQTGNVMKLIFIWSMEKHLMMEEWRYVWMEGGAQCAMTNGISEMLKLCVDNSGIMDVSLYLSLFTISC